MFIVKSRKNCKGSFIAEAPLALWVLFFVFTFPFLDFATIMLRYTFMVSAVRDGVHAAAHAKTFSSNISATNLSAINAASQAANLTASAFSEIAVSNIRSRILQTNITTKVLTIYSYNTALSSVADDSVNLYEIETVVSGSIKPLITMNTGYFPGIPGLTTPLPVTLSAREYCEYPQGLNQ